MKKVKLLALIFAILTALSMFMFIKQINKPVPENLVDVVVAAKQVPIRSALDGSMFTIEQMPQKAVHPLAATKISQVTGLINETEFEQGEQILTSKLIKSGESTVGLSYVIPEGKRAMSVQVDNVAGVAGFIKPGDYVDLLVTIMTSSETDSKELIPVSILMLQNIEVLAVGSRLVSSGNDINSSYESVTLSVTPSDMTDLNIAATQGKIRLALRPPVDQNTIKGRQSTSKSIITR